MLKHATRFNPLAQKGNQYDSNWNALERYFNAQLPVCVTAQGAIATIPAGSPGAISYITWSPPTNPLYDTSNIVGPSATTNLRIPLDGFYDIYYLLQLGASASGSFAIKSVLDVATTANDGYTTPTWGRVVNGPSSFFESNVLSTDGDMYFPVLYRGIEFHANNLFRIGINMFADASGPPVAAITSSVVPLSEFRFAYGIPNAQVRAGYLGYP